MMYSLIQIKGVNLMYTLFAMKTVGLPVFYILPTKLYISSVKQTNKPEIYPQN